MTCLLLLNTLEDAVHTRCGVPPADRAVGGGAGDECVSRWTARGATQSICSTLPSATEPSCGVFSSTELPEESSETLETVPLR